jgi:hypothetical protein
MFRFRSTSLLLKAACINATFVALKDDEGGENTACGGANGFPDSRR